MSRSIYLKFQASFILWLRLRILVSATNRDNLERLSFPFSTHHLMLKNKKDLIEWKNRYKKRTDGVSKRMDNLIIFLPSHHNIRDDNKKTGPISSLSFHPPFMKKVVRMSHDPGNRQGSHAYSFLCEKCLRLYTFFVHFRLARPPPIPPTSDHSEYDRLQE